MFFLSHFCNVLFVPFNATSVKNERSARSGGKLRNSMYLILIMNGREGMEMEMEMEDKLQK
ncbi:hypothetical protein BofuT4_P063220.1 [Botrytis cinerea T4]|uniref:Uncharacterized protein n=1 Tax=Botryotinia fuckeliana (strain T4) TaxID=999810 RepID=G2XTQ6_BOTF4|nr:hypothetical protein BofuT4_P063220.1 [Botrytis cinerea T4]